jgi:hypothetical protein
MEEPLGRPRHIWEDNIKMDVTEIHLDLINLAQDRNWWLALLNMVIDLLVPYKVGNFLMAKQTVSF